MESAGSVMSPKCRSIPKSHFLHESFKNGFSENVKKRNPLPKFSRENIFVKGQCPLLTWSGSDATNSADNFVELSKEVLPAKNKTRRKCRSKENRNRKISCRHFLANPEDTNQIAKVDQDGMTDIEHGGSLPTSSSRLTVPLPEYICDGLCTGVKNDHLISESATPKKITVSTCKVDSSEAVAALATQNFNSKNCSFNPADGCQTNSPQFSMLDGVQNTQPKRMTCSGDPYQYAGSDSLASDSLYLGSKSDKSFLPDNDLNLSSNEIDEICTSELVCSPGSQLSDVLYPENHSQKTNCCRQGINDVVTSCIMGKCNKKFKKKLHTSNAYKTINFRNKTQSGKENNHSIWKKVQRKDVDVQNCEEERPNSVWSQSDARLKSDPLLKEHSNVKDSCLLSISESNHQKKINVHGRPKRRIRQGLKQDQNSNSRKGSSDAKSSASPCEKANMHSDMIYNLPVLNFEQRGVDCISSSDSSVGCSLQTKEDESTTSGSVRASEVYRTHVKECGNVDSRARGRIKIYDDINATFSSEINNAANVQSDLFSSFCHSTNLSELRGPCLHATVDDESAKIYDKVHPAGYPDEDTNSAALLQKWIPIGLIVRTHGLGQSSSSMTDLQGAAGKWTPKHNQLKNSASYPHPFFSSLDVRLRYAGQSSNNIDVLAFEDETEVEKLRNQKASTPEWFCGVHAPAKLLIQSENENRSASEVHSSDSLWRTDDVHKAQWASNEIQMATGSPIAEFENLIHSVSPVVSPSHNIIICQTCFHSQVDGGALCRHETPNVSLQTLWQWYEKHGNYGLEVRAEDYENEKRLGIDRVAFRAYFVPFLSAIQLFSRGKSYPLDTSNQNSRTTSKESSQNKETCDGSSKIGLLPVYSILVPQPRVKNLISFTSEKPVSDSWSSSVCTADNLHDQVVESKSSSNMEVLFEYFESQPPQQRRPLCEMIKELVKGDGPSKCRAYGDPSVLESVFLHNLHPNSWYSVAWYPIYRIPDGKFRAAFLTYHSFGHFVRRGPMLGSWCADHSVVSPVVGLQSYNAQDECWFRPRQPAYCKTQCSSNSHLTEILEARLRTLEKTASLMARAVVTKGNQTSVNRQPDYEFFASRGQR